MQDKAVNLTQREPSGAMSTSCAAASSRDRSLVD